MGKLFYVFGENYKQQFIDYVRLLSFLAKKSSTTYKQRIQKVSEVTNAYITQTGTMPDTLPLDKLSDLILFDDLHDRNPHKSAHSECPILSAKQLDRRRFGGRGEDSNMVGETSLAEAENIGTDGRDYRYPNRRKRTIDELIYVDANARILNEAREKQYKKDTSASKLVRYNLNDTQGKLTESFVTCREIKYHATPK